MSIVAGSGKLSRSLAALGGWLQSPLLLLVRLWWGWSFFLMGKGKFADLPRATAFFESLHLPLPKASVIAAGSVECLGGLLLMLGLFSRVASVPLIFTMAVAYGTAHSGAWHAVWSDPNKFTAAPPFLFLFASILILVFGPGKLSLDALLFGAKTSPRN